MKKRKTTNKMFEKDVLYYSFYRDDASSIYALVEELASWGCETCEALSNPMLIQMSALGKDGSKKERVAIAIGHLDRLKFAIEKRKAKGLEMPEETQDVMSILEANLIRAYTGPEIREARADRMLYGETRIL